MSTSQPTPPGAPDWDEVARAAAARVFKAPRCPEFAAELDEVYHSAFERTLRYGPRSKGQRRPPFSPIPIRKARDAEENACRWLAHLGFAGCKLTGNGADGGVDVRGAGVVAQVKAEVKPVGIEIVQRAYGCACAEGAKAAVFGLSGFTKAAIRWSEEHGVALFSFDLTGHPDPLNALASGLGAR